MWKLEKPPPQTMNIEQRERMIHDSHIQYCDDQAIT